MEVGALVRVLLVDDDPATRTSVGALLENEAFSIECAGSGEEAVKKLRLSRFDLLLLDLMLPGMNGFELLRELNSIDGAMLKRTVIITAASELTLGAFDKTQVYRIVRKPLIWSELIRVIRTCLAAQEESVGNV
jgi:CheY-like chemotaxis protein